MSYFESFQVGVGENLDGGQHTDNEHWHNDCACHGSDDALPVGTASCRCGRSALFMHRFVTQTYNKLNLLQL